MDTVNLTHHFLIAKPGMVDPNFNGTLTYICDHSVQGALGVVVNRPIDLDLSTLFEQIGLSLPERLHKRVVYFGGPVQTERGFVLHMPPQTFSSTLTVNDAVSLTTSKDVLEAVSHGEGPEKFMVSLGYAGWGAGQLEDEIKQNAWLSVAAHPQVILNKVPLCLVLEIIPSPLAASNLAKAFLHRPRSFILCLSATSFTKHNVLHRKASL